MDTGIRSEQRQPFPHQYAVIDFNYHRQQLFSSRSTTTTQRFHLNELPEIIVDAVVVGRDESVLGGGNDICKVARRTLFFARERAEGIKHHSIIPSPQLVPLLFANSDSAKEVSHDTPVGSKSFIDKIRAFSATLQIDHKAHACSCGPSCCLSTHRNIIDLPTSLAFLGGSTQRCRQEG